MNNFRTAAVSLNINSCDVSNIGDATNNGGLNYTCYKLVNCLIDIDYTNFFVAFTNTQSTGYSRKLTRNHILNICDANMFHKRVINFWNKLPNSAVQPPVFLALSGDCRVL